MILRSLRSGERGCEPAVVGSLPATPRRFLTERLKTSLGKLPKLTGWQPVLPRQDCFGETPKPTRETRALPGIIATRVREC